MLENLVKQLSGRLSSIKEKQISIALPGGKSISAFLSCLLDHQAMIDFDRLNFYLVDERISNNEEDLNETLLNKVFFSQLAVPVKTRFDLAANYKAYNNDFETGTRHLDIVFLGVGEDGHVASIFPEQLFPDYGNILSSGKLYLEISGAPKPPPDRVTLSVKAIREAGLIVLLFLGKEKRLALENFLDESVPASDCPAKLFTTVRGDVWVITDLEIP